MPHEQLFNHSQLLENIATELDIPPSKHQQATDRYMSVGNWLSEKYHREVRIYPQGSFQIGTVVRPIKEGRESDYDIDLVCHIESKKSLCDPLDIKHSVGNCLKENATYRNIIDKEGRRCWTLNYAEQDGIGFHLDVLPAVPESNEFINQLILDGISPQAAQKTIAITNRNEKNQYGWTTTNPEAYADWFRSKQTMSDEKILQKKQKIVSQNKITFKSVDDVPDYLIKTPLQMTIQLLKRHRDMRFIDEKDKPISMIITTLAAQLYQNEQDVYTALASIVGKLISYANHINENYNEYKNNSGLIQKKEDGKWHIPNPVNPNENFADRWHENNHSKARAFFRWIKWLNNDITTILNLSETSELLDILQKSFGEQIADKALKKINASSKTKVETKKDTPHRTEISNPIKPWG
ncbi:MAG: nucleotidyltransferase [Gammaproteobacteria bacterium]|jgi:hypothetical protein